MTSTAQSPAVERDPDLDTPIETLIREVVPEPDLWKATPNPQFGYRRPMDLIGTPSEPVLRDVLRAVKHGFFS